MMTDAKTNDKAYNAQLMSLCKDVLKNTTVKERAEWFERWCTGERSLLVVHCRDVGFTAVAFVFVAMMDVNHPFICESAELLRWTIEECFIRIIQSDLHDIKVIHRDMLITPDLSTKEVKL